jgi:hypothetical protein
MDFMGFDLDDTLRVFMGYYLWLLMLYRWGIWVISVMRGFGFALMGVV